MGLITVSVINETFIINEDLYQIRMHYAAGDMVKWCEERFGFQNWITSNKRWEATNEKWCLVGASDGVIFAFVNESDYMEFCLTWL